MNLLVFLPGRILYYYNTSCYQHTSFSQVPNQRYEKLEDLESTLSKKKVEVELSGLLIATESLNDPSFWAMVFDHSVKKGFLSIHHIGGKRMHVECLSTGAQEWSLSFCIGFVNELLTGSVQKSVLNKKSQFLFFVNPGEPQLEYAKQEAVEVMENLCKSYTTRFIQRPLTEFEYYEALEGADCLFYFGHARFMQGHPLIELSSGWTAISPNGISKGLSLLVLGACLETGGELLQVEAECSLYSNCRIADRKNSYLVDFARELAKSKNIAQSVYVAKQRDSQNADIRRFIYRLQGGEIF